MESRLSDGVTEKLDDSLKVLDTLVIQQKDDELECFGRFQRRLLGG